MGPAQGRFCGDGTGLCHSAHPSSVCPRARDNGGGEPSALRPGPTASWSRRGSAFLTAPEGRARRAAARERWRRVGSSAPTDRPSADTGQVQQPGAPPPLRGCRAEPKTVRSRPGPRGRARSGVSAGRAGVGAAGPGLPGDLLGPERERGAGARERNEAPPAPWLRIPGPGHRGGLPVPGSVGAGSGRRCGAPSERARSPGGPAQAAAPCPDPPAPPVPRPAVPGLANLPALRSAAQSPGLCPSHPRTRVSRTHPGWLSMGPSAQRSARRASGTRASRTALSCGMAPRLCLALRVPESVARPRAESPR